MRIWRKGYLDLLKRMRMNNLLISGTISLVGLQVEEFHSSNGWFEGWNTRFNVSFKAIA